MRDADIAKELSRSITSIAHKKNRMGLRKTKKHPEIKVGDVFGEWVVDGYSHTDKNGNNYYSCTCSCSKTQAVRGTELKAGTTKSCGGLAHRDLSGNFFGELEVLSFSHRDENNSTYYNCVCSCGYQKKIRASSLVEGGTKTCGRGAHTSLAGKTFGEWFVVDHSHTIPYGAIYYNCKCSCGTTSKVRKSHLVAGATRSCGCSTSYKGEVAIKEYFSSKRGYKYVEQVPYKGLFHKSSRELIADGVVYNGFGDMVLVIEYDGIQHFERREFFHKTPEDFEEQLVRDSLKDEYCDRRNINLLRIPYWEYDNIEGILDNKIKEIEENDDFETRQNKQYQLVK